MAVDERRRAGVVVVEPEAEAVEQGIGAREGEVDRPGREIRSATISGPSARTKPDESKVK